MKMLQAGLQSTGTNPSTTHSSDFRESREPSPSIAHHSAPAPCPQRPMKTEDVTVKMENNEGTQATTCRVCLLEGSIPIHGNYVFNDVSQDLTTVTGISVQKDDEYPKHLCESCYSLLQGAIQLRVTAQYSDRVLKHRIETVKAVDDIPMGSGDQECLQKAQISRNKDKTSRKDITYISEEIQITISPEVFGSESEEDIKPIMRRCTRSKSKKISDATLRQTDSESKKAKVNKMKCAKVPKGEYYCKKCGIDLETELKYEEHIQSEEHKNFKVKCPICSKEYGPLYIKTHIEYHNTEIAHICDICGKGFVTKNLCKAHRKTHFLDLPFKCTICPYRGRASYHVKRHMESHREKAHQCPECLKLYSTKGNLRKHILTHKPERDFQCDKCTRSFYKKPDLERHIKSDHMGIKDHICDICGKEFGLQARMMKHKLKVHKRQKMPLGKARSLYVMAESQNLATVETDTSANT